MKVVASSKAPKNRIVYHKGGCIYAGRISPLNRKVRDIETVERKQKYCACKYCGGIAGELKVNKKPIARMEKNSGIKVHFDNFTETIYVQTEIGFWKMFYKNELGQYLLYHRNTYDENYSLGRLMHGDYHRQGDVKPADSITPLLNYIVSHDKAKKIIADDYRKLPKQTKKQKKYFNIAKRKAHRQEIRRVDFLFAMIENERKEKELAVI